MRSLLQIASLQKNVRNSVLFCLFFVICYWLISINPFEVWQQNSKFSQLQNELKSLNALSKNQELINELIEANPKSLSLIQEKYNNSLSYQVYNLSDFNLDYWTSNSYFLSNYMLDNIYSLSYREIDQDKFLLQRIDHNGKCLVFWYHLNKYIDINLNNSFRVFHSENERKEYIAIGYKEKTSHDFVDNQGNFLFSLKRIVHSNDVWIILGLLFIIGAIFFFIRALYFFVKPITRLYPVFGCSIFVVVMYLARKVLLFYKLPSIFYTLKLFNPSLYSSDVTPSLGDLFLFVFTTQVILFFLQENLKLNLKRFEGSIFAFLMHTIALIFLLGESFSINKIFERMVVESSIWFNFDYFPRLTIYSFIGLGIMLMTFSNYYLLSNIILKTIHSLKLNRQKRLISFMVFIVSVIGLILFTEFRIEIKLSFILLVFFILIFYARYLFDIKSQVYSFIVFLFFASFTTTFLLSRYNIKKEEVILSSIATNVTFGLDNSFENEMIKLLNSPSTALNVKDIGNTKSVEITVITQLDYQKILENSNLLNLKLVSSNSKFKLFNVRSNTGRHYLLEHKSVNGIQYFAIHPKTPLNASSSTTRDAINDIIISENRISYGLYIQNKLQDQSGLFSYKSALNEKISTGKIADELYGLDFEHSVFSYPNDIKVLVTSQKANPVSLLTQFSYIFCMNFLLSLILFFVVWSLRITYVSQPLLKFNELRSKIVLAIFLLIVGIFCGITFLSFNSLKSKFTNYNKEVSYNNLKVTQQAIEQVFNSNDLSSIHQLSDFFKKLKGISSLHYDLYDSRGILNQSSYTNIQALTYPSLVNPKVYFDELKGENKVTKDIQDLNEIVSYTKLIDKPNSTSYILKLFIPKNEKSQNEELRLIVVLINLYVLFFLISMLFAIWLANRITKPLQTLTDKISNLGLDRKNEYLEYQYDDEIGELVKRYNIMVDEIQASARLLAEQEREEAWSEMAKQIAHEIKNPLTPMKLKIQFLQRKMKDGGGNVEALVASTADTLIEQINNLDSIATSFSSFGKLHNPHFEKMDWVSLITNTIDVFQSKDAHIFFKTHIDEAVISCDRNQMISCLNNLVKNALQAYDDEEASVELTLSENLNFYFLEIRDYGKGIKEEEKDKLFVPNFTTKSSGSGLGLAITKKILNAMNGQIWFESTLGKGTSFYVSLPKIEIEKEVELTQTELDWIEKGFTQVQDRDIYVDLECSQTNNVFQTKLYKDFNFAFLNELAYNKLLNAKDLLKEVHPNYRLIIKDALRPFEIQKLMWESYQGENKERYIAPPDRDSMHNYGMAVDVLILEVFEDAHNPNRILDFGCDFDEFSIMAEWEYDNLNEEQTKNRELLKTVMLKAGFIMYESEFWHFEAMHKDWVRTNCTRV